MTPDVKNWLLKATSPELFGLYDFADSVLLKLGYTKAESVGLLSYEDGFGTSEEFLDRLRNIYVEGCREVISIHGIVTRSNDLKRLSQVVYALRLLSDTDDLTTIGDILTRNDDDHRMAMAELLSFMAGGDWTIYHSEIDFVSSELISRLAERTLEMSMESRVDPASTAQIKAFAAKFQQSLMGYAIQEDGAMPGITLETLFENYRDQLQRMCPDNAQRYAIEAYGLAILAGIPDAEKINTINALIRDYTKDTNFSMLVSTYMNHLHQEFKARG